MKANWSAPFREIVTVHSETYKKKYYVFACNPWIKKFVSMKIGWE
jgi:hypothetical protein